MPSTHPSQGLTRPLAWLSKPWSLSIFFLSVAQLCSSWRTHPEPLPTSKATHCKGWPLLTVEFHVSSWGLGPVDSTWLAWALTQYLGSSFQVKYMAQILRVCSRMNVVGPPEKGVVRKLGACCPLSPSSLCQQSLFCPGYLFPSLSSFRLGQNLFPT